MGGWDGSQYVKLQPLRQCWKVGFRSPEDASATATRARTSSTTGKRHRGTRDMSEGGGGVWTKPVVNEGYIKARLGDLVINAPLGRDG